MTLLLTNLVQCLANGFLVTASRLTDLHQFPDTVFRGREPGGAPRAVGERMSAG